MRDHTGSRRPYRHEIKYICTQAQLALLGGRISTVCQLDEHAGSSGKYNIRSVYFDDYQNSCYYDNQNGANPRSKYRIRIYNHDASRITLERKSKQYDKTWKESCPLTTEQCRELLAGMALWRPDHTMPALLRRFYIEYKTRLLRPAVIVEYERIPYVCRDGNVRITFDQNISSSRMTGSFLEDELMLRPVMPCGQHILEVKYDGFLPDVIYNSLQLRDLHRTACSKYYLCRKYQ